MISRAEKVQGEADLLAVLESNYVTAVSVIFVFVAKKLEGPSKLGIAQGNWSGKHIVTAYCLQRALIPWFPHNFSADTVGSAIATQA